SIVADLEAPDSDTLHDAVPALIASSAAAFPAHFDDAIVPAAITAGVVAIVARFRTNDAPVATLFTSCARDEALIKRLDRRTVGGAAIATDEVSIITDLVGVDDSITATLTRLARNGTAPTA